MRINYKETIFTEHVQFTKKKKKHNPRIQLIFTSYTLKPIIDSSIATILSLFFTNEKIDCIYQVPNILVSEKWTPNPFPPVSYGSAH